MARKIELFSVYIGGSKSMKLHVCDLPDNCVGIADFIRMEQNSRYITHESIALRDPDRLVIVFGYADHCRSIRNEIFRIVGMLSWTIKSMGDVMVALNRLHETENELEFILPEATCLSTPLFDTVTRLGRDSKLLKRLAEQKL